MGEKKTIYYSRTYRRLGGNTLGCVIQICLLTIPFLLAVLFHMGDLTRLMCKAVRYVFADVCPDIFVFTQTKRYKPYGDKLYRRRNRLSGLQYVPLQSPCLRRARRAYRGNAVAR